MAKSVEIEIIDKKLVTTTTGGGVPTVSQNNVPNDNFNVALGSGNIGQAGCTLSLGWVGLNMNSASGAPNYTNWLPASFKEGANGGTPNSFCGIFYRETPIPYRNASSQCVFPGTIAPANIDNFVRNGFFVDNLSGGNTGFINNIAYLDDVGAPQPGGFQSFDAVGNAIAAGNISDIPPSSSAQNQWWSSRSVCFNAGNSPAYWNPVNTPNPQIFPSQGGCRLERASVDTCSAGGFYGTSAIYQLITGLVPGRGYQITIDLDNPDTTGYGYLKFGSAALVGGLTVSGQTYVNIGEGSAMYGNSGVGGSWQDQASNNIGTAFFDCQSAIPQVNTFIAQGGNEVLSIEYFGLSTMFGAANGDRIDIATVRIEELPEAPYNVGTIYALSDSKNTPSGLGTYTGNIVIDVTQADLATDAIVISQDQFPIQGSTAAGLQPISNTPIVASNNPAWSPTHPLTLGINTISFVTNFSDSVAPFNPEDRLLGLSVISESGNDVIISAADYQYTTYSQSTTTETIDYDKSIVGKLEVSNSEDFPLNISYNISDGKDLESRFGDYSQSFDLPATANNNKILNNIWKPTVDQSLKKTFGIKDCRLMVDGTPFFEGSMQIKNSSQKDSPDSYSCTLYGGNFSWMTLLKDKFLCETFGADEEFIYTYQEIENTWVLNSSNSYIQYPLISYKDFNTDGLDNYVNTFDETKLPDLQPAFYVKVILEKIFEGIGYTLDSTFLDTQHFSRLINTFPFLSNTAVDDGIFYSSAQGRAVGDVQEVLPCANLGGLSGWHTFILNQNDSDSSNSYNNSTGVWTCQKAGQYSVNAQTSFIIALGSDAGGPDCSSNCTSTNCDWEYTSSSPSDAWTWASRVKVTFAAGGTDYVGTTSAGWGQSTLSPLNWGTVGCADTSTQFTTIPQDSIILNVGDTLELQGQHIGQNLLGCDPKVLTVFGYTSNTIPSGGIRPQMIITYDDTAPKLGGIVNYNNILPCGVSQTDYIKSISQLFNLYFTTDVQSKTVYVEPFNEFFKPKSEGLDWEMKVDYSKDIVDDYDIGIKRELNLAYKADSGDVFAREQNFKANIYGSTAKLYDYNENLGEDYESGDVNIVNQILASSTQVWDNDAHDSPDASKAPVLIPNLWNIDCYAGIGLGNNQWRPDSIIGNFVPRIFYYCWENPVSFTTINNGLGVVNPSGTQTYWSRVFSSGSAFQNQTVYPRATFVDWEELQHSSTMRPSLSFTDESFTAPGQTALNEVPGLYTTYYKNMIEQLKQSPRIRNVYINLKATDILNLDLRKLVYIDGSWWRINRVSEFSPAQNQSTKVELIQWLDVGYYPIYENGTIIKYT